MRKRLVFAALLSFTSVSAQAVETPHTVELRGVFGIVDASIKKGSTTEELNDLSSGHYGVSYSYAIHNNFTLGIEKYKGDSEAFIEISDLFTDSKLDYDLLNIVATARYPMSPRGNLYGRLFTTKYDYDVYDDGKVVGSDSGSDIGFGIGWQYTFDSNFEFSLGYESMSMGSDIDLSGVSWSLGYRF